MKVLLINGSPRQQGNTATALAEVAKRNRVDWQQTCSRLCRLWPMLSPGFGTLCV